MTIKNSLYRISRWMFVLVFGILISAVSFSASTVHAEEPVQEQQSAEMENAASSENGGAGVMLLMGGMLLIIIAVVVTVVATVVSTAPIADEV